ncbi:hypothetical protein D3C85_850790 [compost metagenome]
MDPVYPLSWQSRAVNFAPRHHPERHEVRGFRWFLEARKKRIAFIQEADSGGSMERA